MPAQHNIDNNRRLITTLWIGGAVDSELIEALTKYQQDIKSQPDYFSYNEIVDFGQASSFKLSTQGIMTLAHLATNTDSLGVKTKLAIVVNNSLAYGLGRMYVTYRSLVPRGIKDVHVFMSYHDALEWIEAG
ncbi:MAG: STAS/SEC14 domain-containing protein [Nitrospirota bacterium]